MTLDDDGNDHVLAAVASLKPYDVSRRHASRLRRRCHARLRTPLRPETSAAMAQVTAFERIIGPALGVAWCLLYLVEVMRRAAVYFGTQ